MRLGISVKIDVTKILKDRLYVGEKGTYLNMTTFVDTEEKDQYDNHGFISQETSKEERDQGVKTPILGNVKVFFTGESKDKQDKQEKLSDGEQGFPDKNTFPDIDSEKIPF